VKYGKDMFLAIEKLGTDRLPVLFALKGRFDAFASRIPVLPRDLSDRLHRADLHADARRIDLVEHRLDHLEQNAGAAF
jgi:D-lactate dehydrogenase, membrane binding